MSQGYPPYQPPQPGYYGYAPHYPGPLAKSKRAAILQFVVAGLLMAGGFCFSAFSQVDESRFAIDPSQRERLDQLHQMGASISSMCLTLAVIQLVPGITMMAMAFPLRKGRRGAVIGSVIVQAIMILLMLFLTITSLLGNPLGAIFFLLPLGVFAWQIIWTVQSFAEANPAAMAQYQQQWAASQYQQAMYQQQPQPPAGYAGGQYYAQPPAQQYPAQSAGFPAPPAGQPPLSPQPVWPQRPQPPQQTPPPSDPSGTV